MLSPETRHVIPLENSLKLCRKICSILGGFFTSVGMGFLRGSAPPTNRGVTTTDEKSLEPAPNKAFRAFFVEVGFLKNGGVGLTSTGGLNDAV